MKAHKHLSVILALALLLAACATPTATTTPNTQPPQPTAAVVATSAPEDTSAPEATTPPDAPEATAAPDPTEAPAEDGFYNNYYFVTPADYEAATGNTIAEFHEAPSLTERVAAGELPPLAERLPTDVAIVRTRDGSAAVYGGEMHLSGFFEGAGVFTQFTEDTQKGLLAWDVSYRRNYPDLAKGWQLADDALSLQLYLREGMKWSDGDPFDADDFIFWYEDLLQNTELNPEIDPNYMPGGELMGLTKLDQYTLEFTFAVPYPRAAEIILNTDEIYRPGHFLKNYLPKYNPDADALAQSEGLDSWQLALEFHQSYNADPLMPSLLPWIISDIGADSALWVRNPYYHRVDTDGNQLPYIDSLLVSIASDPNSTNPVKVMAGEIDWEIMGLTIEDYPVLKGAEAQGQYHAYLWPDDATSSAMSFALNYTHQDPFLREIFNDLRFRQALSLAIDREDINQTIFFGQTEAFVAPVGRTWSGFEDWMATYYAEHDVDAANALLDEMGLEWDANHEYRLRPDGQPISILGEQTVDYLAYADDLLQIVATNWKDVGIRFEPKFVPGDVLMPRYVANQQDIGIWNTDGGTEPSGHTNYPIRLLPPWHHMGSECCPISSYPWRQWLDTDGAEGEEPPDTIKEMYRLAQEWLAAEAGTPEYDALANQLITLNVENLYFFGTVSAPPRVVITSDRLGNLPGEDGAFGSEMLRPYLAETAYLRP